MSAVETGQMSAAETGQMSAVETRQMSSVARTNICFVLTHNVEVPGVSNVSVSMLKSQKSQLSQYHNVPAPDMSIAPIPQCSSLRHLNCGNVIMFKSQISGLALNRRKWSEMGPEWSPGLENRSP